MCFLCGNLQAKNIFFELKQQLSDSDVSTVYIKITSKQKEANFQNKVVFANRTILLRFASRPMCLAETVVCFTKMPPLNKDVNSERYLPK